LVRRSHALSDGRDGRALGPCFFSFAGPSPFGGVLDSGDRYRAGLALEWTSLSAARDRRDHDHARTAQVRALVAGLAFGTARRHELARDRRAPTCARTDRARTGPAVFGNRNASQCGIFTTAISSDSGAACARSDLSLWRYFTRARNAPLYRRRARILFEGGVARDRGGHLAIARGPWCGIHPAAPRAPEPSFCEHRDRDLFRNYFCDRADPRRILFAWTGGAQNSDRPPDLYAHGYCRDRKRCDERLFGRQRKRRRIGRAPFIPNADHAGKRNGARRPAHRSDSHPFYTRFFAGGAMCICRHAFVFCDRADLSFF